MYKLGLLFYNGQGVDQDYAKAREWFQKGADASNADAMAYLGWLYRNGLGVTQDYPQAREWCQKAAEAGNTYADEAGTLAKQEFAFLDARFKGDQFNDLVARLRTPVEIASVSKNIDAHFPEAVQEDDREFVSATVLSIIDEYRALDGILLAEALAESSFEDKLLSLYQREEAGLAHLTMAFQYWYNAPRRK